MTDIIAIDPGKTGAIAMLGESLDIYDMPDIAAAVVALIAELSFGSSAICLIEQQQAMPKQGLSSTFGYGVHCGVLTGAAIAAGLPLHFVTPIVWKRKLGLLGKTKRDSRELASRVFPICADQFARAKDDGRAEAALLAFYGRLHVVGHQQGTGQGSRVNNQ